MMQRFEKNLDLFDHLAVLQIESTILRLFVYKRLFSKYECVQTTLFKPTDSVNSSINLFSKDQRIPCIFHYISSAIKETVITLNDIEDDEIDEAIERQKKNIFGISRLKNSRLEKRVLAQTDTTKFIKLSLIPENLSLPKLSEPLIFLTSLYNSFSFNTQAELSVLALNNQFFIQAKQDEKLVYQNASISLTDSDSDQSLTRINRLLEQFQSDTGRRLPNQIELLNFPHHYDIQQFQHHSINSDFYAEQIIASIDLNQITNTSAAYLKRQRLFKATAFFGIFFLALFVVSELFAFTFEAAANYYAGQVTALSTELYQIDQLNQDIKLIENDKREILSLLDTRSQVSYQIHSIAANFETEKIWLKRIHFDQKFKQFLLEGFAKDETDFNLLIEKLADHQFKIKPLTHEIRNYSDLAKNENLYFRRLLHFTIEMSQ